MGPARGHIEGQDKMAEKRVIVWAKPGGLMRDKMADKKVMMWAKVGGIMRDKT